MFPAYTKILLAASWSGFKTEIIDFKNPSFTCSKLNQFPKQTAGAVGGMVGDTPFVCGGYTSSHGHTTTCYVLQENGEWKQSSNSLSTVRFHAGYTVMKNQLVVVGGSGGSGQRTIEVLSPTTKSRTLHVELPKDLSGTSGRYCVVPWDEDTFMVIGTSDKTYFIDMVTDKLSNGPKMHDMRYNHVCNEMTVNGETFIVVAGGKTTEVLSKSSKNNYWKRSNIF